MANGPSSRMGFWCKNKLCKAENTGLKWTIKFKSTELIKGSPLNVQISKVHHKCPLICVKEEEKDDESDEESVARKPKRAKLEENSQDEQKLEESNPKGKAKKIFAAFKKSTEINVQKYYQAIYG